MVKKRNFKQELKDFWEENKRVIKVGAACLFGGTAVGFIKGALTVTSSLNDVYAAISSEECDEAVSTDETDYDDSDLLELVRDDQKN